MTTLARHGVPRTVLNGKDRKYAKVTNRYRARFIEELYRLLYISFLIRSNKGTDPVAGKWSPLKKRTIYIKRKLGVANPHQINVRTGALLESTMPGKVVGGRYYKRKGQVVTISPYTITFGLDIDYADAVDSLRTLIPEDIGPWIVTAHENVIAEIRTMYYAMRADYKKRADEIAERRRNRSKRNPRN